MRHVIREEPLLAFRSLAVLLAIAFFIPALRASDEAPANCPATRLPEHPFIPPAAYHSLGNSWIGTPKLWTFIPETGTWPGLPHYTPEDFRFRQKLFWWSEGYNRHNDTQSQLIVTGKRLDGDAPPLATDEHANAGWTGDKDHPFMVVGIFIPTLGCWEITGEYKGERLSYIVWLSEPECIPSDSLSLIKPVDPAYADAMELAETLRAHGFIVECVLQSKTVYIFEGQEGAVLFRPIAEISRRSSSRNRKRLRRLNSLRP